MEASPENFVIIETDHTGRARSNLDNVVHFRRANGKMERVGHVPAKFALEGLVQLVPMGGQNNSNVEVVVPAVDEMSMTARQINMAYCFGVILAGMLQFAQLLYSAHLTYNWYQGFLYAGENAGMHYWQQIAYFVLFMMPFVGSVMWWQKKLKPTNLIAAMKAHVALLERMPASRLNYMSIALNYYTLLLYKGLFKKMYKAVRTLIFYAFGGLIIMTLTRTHAPALQSVLGGLYDIVSGQFANLAGTAGNANNNMNFGAFRRG